MPVLQESVSLFCAEVGSQKQCLCYKSLCRCFVQRLGVRNNACVTRVSVAVLCRGWESETMPVLECQCCYFVKRLGVRNNACVRVSVLLFCEEAGSEQHCLYCSSQCCCFV